MIDFTSSFVWLNALLFLAGIALLVKGSDFFVASAASMAKRLGVSDVVIGLTLVSIGTSLPELAANICASVRGASAIALGNIVGSNFTNVALILGLSCLLMRKISIPDAIRRRDVFYLVGASILLAFLLFAFRAVSFWSGVLFLAIAVWYVACLVKKKEEIIEETSGETSNILSPAKITLLFPLGLLMIFAGSKMVVDNTIWASVKMGISQTVIASTVVALGTSLPELAVTISGVLRKQNGIAVGNIIGSNIFNIFFILGVSAVINPVALGDSTMAVNVVLLLVSDGLLLLFLLLQRNLYWWNGVIFLLLYASFLIRNGAKVL